MQNQNINLNRLVINADLGTGEISKYIYGHFAEHLGRCIYEGIWVGKDSEIPHTRGIRNDVVQALRKINIPVLRWPGGCFADEYHWQDGIGPYENRPCMVNTHWGGVTENNHFGTHEFFDLCSQLECEPYICGNAGSGSVQEMQQWVEYITFGGRSPMADLRKTNGREEPWKVRFWGIGNENWGCGGNMRPEFYADQFRRYATYCRNFDGNKLYKIACGSNGDDFRWTEVLMREAGKFCNGLSYHHYIVPGTWASKGSATNFTEKEWFITLQKALQMDALIARHSAIMDYFDPDRQVGMIMDEWGIWHDAEPGSVPGFLYQQNTMRDALVAGIILNIFNKHCARIFMANIAQTINVLQAMILTRKEKMMLTPTYHVFEMYKVHQGATLLPVFEDTMTYKYSGDLIPALNVSASRDRTGTMHITLCNLNPHTALQVSCEIRGMQPGRVNGRVLTAGEITAHNTFENPAAVAPAVFNGTEIEGSVLQIELPSKSVAVLEVK